MSQDHLIDLETRLLYQERMLQDLNEVVTKQQDQIDQLVSNFNAINSQLAEIRDRGDGSQDLPHEKPPHY